MDTFFHLTAEERQKIFERVPAKLKSAWEKKVLEETIDAYETPEELKRRMETPAFDKYPEAKAFAEKVAKKMEAGGSIDDVPFSDFPKEAIPTLLYNLGACGVTALMELAFQQPELDEDVLEDMAALSRARHRILQINAVLA